MTLPQLRIIVILKLHFLEPKHNNFENDFLVSRFKFAFSIHSLLFFLYNIYPQFFQNYFKFQKKQSREGVKVVTVITNEQK